MSHPTVAVVLPPREAFSPLATGAIGLVVHGLAAVPGPFRSAVYGVPTAAPFADVAFCPVRPTMFGAGQARRYAAAHPELGLA